MRDCAGHLPWTVSPRDKDAGHSSIHFPSVISWSCTRGLYPSDVAHDSQNGAISLRMVGTRAGTPMDLTHLAYVNSSSSLLLSQIQPLSIVSYFDNSISVHQVPGPEGGVLHPHILHSPTSLYIFKETFRSVVSVSYMLQD